MTTDVQPGVTSETRKVASLKPDPKNARRHTENQIAQVAASIESFGFVSPVVIRPNGQIIGGHATVQALQRLDRTDVDCRVVAGLSEAKYKALGLALNKIPENSAWDDDVLRDTLIELDAAGEEALGFTPAERERRTKDEDPLEVREIESGPVDDEFWISIRGPLKHQAGALKALQESMKPFADVTVDLGTINVG
jgi:ParB-like chromosome segregation protein Spo0J